MTKEPTIKQKLTFRSLLEAIESKEPWDLKTLMLKAGYTEATAKNPGKNLLSKTGWQQLLSQIDDTMILAKIYEILLDKDKRSSLTAADMLLKLKDKYPAQKSKIVGLFDTISGLEKKD